MAARNRLSLLRNSVQNGVSRKEILLILGGFAAEEKVTPSLEVFGVF